MFMMTQKYNKVKFYLTSAIRELELSLATLKDRNKDSTVITNYEYWVETLDLTRSCLYEEINEFYTKTNILEMIRELQGELSNAFRFVHNKLINNEQKQLASAWLYCKKAGDELECANK